MINMYETADGSFATAHGLTVRDVECLSPCQLIEWEKETGWRLVRGRSGVALWGRKLGDSRPVIDGGEA